LTLDQPHREIRIVVHGVVETLDEQATLPDEGELSPLTYLGDTSLTHADERLRAFAAEHLRGMGDRYSQLVELAESVCEVVRYEPGATEVHESAATVFARQKGVCQDHAHVFIACCRSAGVPARYVSGYLYTGDEGHIASHAWVDAWIEQEQSWRSIDVTHRKSAHTNYCRLAVGRDYLDACPVRGVRRGGGHEDMQVIVTVGASAQQ
jgi:transglutaminase-like putative cysteine protease